MTLPSSLSSPVSISSGNTSVAFTLEGASGTASVSGPTATYSSVLPATNASYTVNGIGVKEDLDLSSVAAPSSFTWSLNLSSGLSAQPAADGGLTLMSGDTSVGAIATPMVTDADGTTADASYSLSPDGTTLTLSIDSAWLSSPDRTFPVVVDPTWYYVLTATNACTLEAAHPTTSFCNTTDTSVGAVGGSAERGVVYFPSLANGTIPVDAKVQGAVLQLPIDSVTGSVTVNAYPMTRGFTSNTTWNTYDGTHSWTTAGGDYASSPTTSAAVGGGSTFDLNMSSSLTQAWVNGGTASDGIELKASNETSGTNVVNFKAQSALADFLNVIWSPDGGTSSSFPLYQHQLDDHLSLAVNTANGNLALHATDLNIAGTGLPEVFDRYYNSASGLSDSAAGLDWSTGVGADIQAQVNFDNVTVYLPGQQPEVFEDSGSTWITPPGVDGILSEPTSGNYALTFNASQEVYNFNRNSNCGDNPLSSILDRKLDTITYHYATSGACSPDGFSKLTSITDTQGRTTTVSAGSFINGLSDPQTPTPRTVGYNYSGYMSSQLTSTQDTSGNTTYYAYDPSTLLLNKITDPNGNITLINYDSDDRVQSVTYVTNVAMMTGPTYAFAYTPGYAASPDTGQTTMTDPLGHTTTYYYDHLDNTLRVVDGNGHFRAATYNPDNQPRTISNAAGMTTLGYDSLNNLNSALSPPSAGGQTGATSSASYATPTGSGGSPYLASSGIDPQNNCTAATYDHPSGNLQTVYEGLAPSGGNCDGATGPDYAQAGYEGDSGVTSCGGPTGVLCTVQDPNGNVTTYGYDSVGNLTSITPPSPQSSESITYDSLSRVHTITDGNGNKTKYSYDAMDRVTQVLYCGTGTCPTPSSTNSISYTYDDDGNLTQRVDNTGTTTWVYDAMNRLKKEELPSGSDACSGSSPAGITYGYDTASNQTSMCDAQGSTGYTYDNANQETTLVEPGGTGGCTIVPLNLTTGCTAFAYDTSGRRTETQFPGGATETVGYLPSGLVQSVTGADSSGTTQTSFTYNYTQPASATTDRALVYQRVENDPSTGGSNVTTTYTYDGDNRLIQAVIGSTTYNYSYDMAGNRCANATSCSSPTFTYNHDNEIKTSPAGTSYSFDTNGNETAGYSNISGASTAVNASYNNRNQTSSITPSGGSTRNFTYADSNSADRTASGTTAFDSSRNQIDRRTNSSASTYYIRDAQGILIGENISGTSYYYLHDDIGSIVDVMSGTGSPSDRYSYDPYGNVISSSGSVANPWQFAGGYADSSTGLLKFGNRYYDPTTGRWTQEDVLSGNVSNPQSLNRYVYAGDDPINNVDPSGKDLFGDIVGAVAGVVGLGVAITGAFVASPILIGVGIGLAVYGVFTTIDQVACDEDSGIGCGVF